MRKMTTLETLILSHLIYSESFSRKAIPYILPRYFEGEGEKLVFRVISDYTKKHNKPPLKDVILIELDQMNDLSEPQFEAAVRITNELSNMRNSTMMMLAGFIILVVAAVAGKRRRVGIWDEEEYDDEIEEEEEFDLPEAVTDGESESEEIADDEEDDDLDEIELIDD